MPTAISKASNFLSTPYDFIDSYKIIMTWKEITVKPLIWEIAESVWNDVNEKAKPDDKNLQPKHFSHVQILIEQVLKENKTKLKWDVLFNCIILIDLKMTILVWSITGKIFSKKHGIKITMLLS